MAEALSWKLFSRPAECWQAMEKDCLAAKESIECELYILNDGAAGRRFLNVFLRKLREGAKVRLLLDSIGSARNFRSKRLKVLQRRGAKAAFFNPVHFWRALTPAACFPRTHAKVMLIDRRVLYVGGMGIDARMRDWFDAQLRVTGPVTRDAAMEFDRLWRRFFRTAPADPAPAPRNESGFRFIVSKGMRKNAIYRAAWHQLRFAQTRVRLSTPYFIPSRFLKFRLRRLARRGVRVELLVSFSSDVPIADWVSFGYYAPLLRAGVKIYRYMPSVMHAKMVLVDDGWATVGSMNLDHLSLFRNREANLIVTEPRTLQALQAQFDAALTHCREATIETLGHRPLHARLGGGIFRMVKSFL